MEKEKFEALLIDYIDDRLNAVDKHMVEEELLENAEARKSYEALREVILVMNQSARLQPGAGLKAKFETMLEQEVRSASRPKMILFRPSFYRAAAAIALVLISGFIGFWISENNAQQNRLADIEEEMALTRKQLADTRQLMFGMLENEQSASQRIRGVNVAMNMSDADNEIVKALMNTMLSDPSTNVRLAALDALSKFQHDANVKKALIEALPRQRDPMVQISLIQLLVRMKEKQVVKDLQDIVDDGGAMKAVRDEAYNGLLKLS